MYIREAHPIDGWQVESNPRDGVLLAQHREAGERRDAAAACTIGLKLTIPMLLDGMDNAVDLAFNAWPERLYVVGTDGRVLYKGGKGPYGFDPPDLARFLTESTGSPA